PMNADRSSERGILTESRNPPVHDNSRRTARGVRVGSFTDTRVVGVRRASMRLSSRSALTLNQDDAPGFARSFGPMTSSAWITARACRLLNGLRFASTDDWFLASAMFGVMPTALTDECLTIC